MKLRPYQLEAIDLARESFAKGNKDIALTLCTGAGKSPITRELVKLFRDKNPDGKIGYFTFRTVLINQMKQTLEGLDVEINTLQAIGKTKTDLYDFIIVDEVHYARNSKLQNNLNAKYKLGLTATPITPDGYALDFDEVIDVVQLADLIDMKFAAPVKVLATSKVDTSKLKTVGKDFSQKDSFDLMSKSSIVKDIVDVYNRYAQGLKTIVYGVNIKHCEQIKDEFVKAGIICDSIHSKKNDTQKSLEAFKNNEIDVLVNCDVLTTGFDAPDIYCLILASPTKSYIKSTQIYGRATRLNPADPNKEALIIDCANVIENTQHPLARFDFTKKKTEKFTKCPACENKMKLLNRRIELVDKYEYNVISNYECSCGETLEQITPKLVNISICDGCGEEFQSIGSLKMESDTKSLSFKMVCECGHERDFREILYTEDEFREVKLKDALENGATWEDVSTILKAECKTAGYKWQYSLRLVDHLKAKRLEPKAAIDEIKKIKKMGKKISALMYM